MAANIDRVFVVSALSGDLNLAKLWAQGGSDKELIDQLTVKLRGMMGRYIRLEEVPELPTETKSGPPMTQVFTVSRNTSTPNLAVVQEQSRFVRKAEIVTLERARKDFRNSWPAPERTLPRIVEKLLKTNCVFDAELTRQVLAKKIDSLYSANQYEPGRAIVHRGSPRIVSLYHPDHRNDHADHCGGLFPQLRAEPGRRLRGRGPRRLGCRRPHRGRGSHLRAHERGRRRLLG